MRLRPSIILEVFDKTEIIDMLNTAKGQDEELAENSSEDL